MRSRRVALCAAALCGAARGALDAPAPPASHPYAPPPPYYAEAQPAYAQNLWEIPPPPDARVALRPFRLATKQSVAFVYGLMAWRATSLAERAAAFGTPGAPLAKPLFAMNAAGCLIAARGAQKRKVALKAMLGVDVAGVRAGVVALWFDEAPADEKLVLDDVLFAANRAAARSRKRRLECARVVHPDEW